MAEPADNSGTDGQSVPPFAVCTHTASDGYVWRYRRYQPPAAMPPRAHVVMIHGIQSHGGWYEHSCTRLSEAGFLVSFLDRRGAGLNDKARGDVLDFRRLLDDVAEFLSLSPPLPFSHSSTFLVGISWGGKLAAALPRYRPGLIDGVALLCPGFFPQVTARQKRLAFFAGLIGMALPQRRFPVPLDDPALFTETARWQEFLRHDPLAVHEVTGHFLLANLDLDRYLRYVPRHIHLPMLLMLAEKDRIIDNTATRRFYQRVASEDKEIIEYPGAHHTLEFEPDPERFIGDLIDWLGRHEMVSDGEREEG